MSETPPPHLLERYLNVDTHELAVTLLVYPTGMVALSSEYDNVTVKQILHQVIDSMPDEDE